MPDQEHLTAAHMALIDNGSDGRITDVQSMEPGLYTVELTPDDTKSDHVSIDVAVVTIPAKPTQ
jgi:hypothetical protein